MNEVCGVFVRDRFMLLARSDNPKSMSIVWAAQDSTGHSLYHFDTVEAASKALSGVTFGVLFDGRHTSKIRRYLRYVRRSGQTMFPDWIPREFKAGILVYRDSAKICYREIAANFEQWVHTPPPPRHQKQPRPSPGRNSWEMYPHYFS